jgi:predicted nucleic acid-binding protein
MLSSARSDGCGFILSAAKLWLWQAELPLARKYRLTAYGAAYLRHAKGEGMRLATMDRAPPRVAGCLAFRSWS